MLHIPLILGHRGCAAKPENTLPAFRYALENGADGVEFDVQLTADNVPIVIHDETVDRTVHGQGYVKDFTLAQIKALAIKEAKGVTVPTLEEVLEVVGEYKTRPLLINVEIKSPGAAAGTIGRLEHYVDRKGWNYKDFLVSSFVHDELRHVKHYAPDFPLGLLYEPEEEPQLDAVVKELQPYSIHPSLKELHSNAFNPFAYNKPIIVWIGGEQPFPGNMPGIREAVAKGVNVVITNFPREVKAAFLAEK